MHPHPEVNFRERVIFAFLVVPWMPLVTMPAYFAAVNPYKFLDLKFVGPILFLSFIVAMFTYLLGVVILIPLWRSMLRSNKTSLLRFSLYGFAMTCHRSFEVGPVFGTRGLVG